jgi:ABC-type transporter Mla subunit MlaD
MKNKLLFIGVSLILIYANAEAGYFLAENDGDIDRVYNNVHSFWSQHQDECRVFSRIFSSKNNESTELAEEEKEAFGRSLENIIRSQDELVDEIRNNPQMAVQDINETLSKIGTDQNDKKSNSLRKGLILIKRVIYSFQ